MNAHYTNRAKQAIAECDGFIDKESLRNKDLRPTDIQEHLNFCIRRRNEMIELLDKELAA